ncbi:hypothetical protein NDU88_004983 [Pleurodeles waltl]|uniref:Uncharacterized protein n=1 Tax=Pleurodeles waltl TaxID=8319 RepID=A0AAV7RIE5_PLEWA|nr:hypothetical protein NDU88_004983 [Pleurodeles waltl]
MVLVKSHGFGTKGRSSFKGPFRIKEVKRNMVVLDNEDVWSMTRIVEWSNVTEDATTLENQEGSTMEPSRTKGSSRLRSKSRWLEDYVP